MFKIQPENNHILFVIELFDLLNINHYELTIFDHTVKHGYSKHVYNELMLTARGFSFPLTIFI